MKKGFDMREEDLDGLFAEARGQTPLDSDALMGRVVADAITHQPQPSALPIRRETAHKSAFWSRIAVGLGGKGVLAGLGTAMVAGVMLGFAQPSSLTTLTEAIFAQTPLDAVELLPGIDAILAEG
jgi:hypothetical protein